MLEPKISMLNSNGVNAFVTHSSLSQEEAVAKHLANHRCKLASSSDRFAQLAPVTPTGAVCFRATSLKGQTATQADPASSWRSERHLQLQCHIVDTVQNSGPGLPRRACPEQKISLYRAVGRRDLARSGGQVGAVYGSRSSCGERLHDISLTADSITALRVRLS